MRYTVRAKGCRLSVKVGASFGETFDEHALATFSWTNLQGFLKPKLIQRKYIEFSGPIGKSLFNRLKRPITKRDFLYIVEQFVIAVRELRANALRQEYLVMDLRYVFINEYTREVQFLYIPGYAVKQQTDILSFLYDIIYSVRPAPETDTDYLSRFIFSLRGQKYLDLDRIEDLVTEEDRSVSQTLRKTDCYNAPVATHQNNCDDGDQAGKRNNATLLIDEGDIWKHDWTVLLDKPRDRVLIHAAALYCIRTQELICLNKPVFRMGKEPSHVDCVVRGNSSVSRIHADIVTRGGKYYIIDHDSMNGTYINDHRLTAHCETEIRDGDHLRLADEEFVFSIGETPVLNSTKEGE